MLKLKEVPQEEMSEVVRLAAEMQHRDEARGMEKTATVAAAEEVGISAEYLEKAAEELQIRRIAKAQAKRRRNTTIGTVVASVVGLGAVGFGFSLLMKPPLPLSLPTTGAIARVSEGTMAQPILANNNSVTLTVDGFRPLANGDYYANAAIPLTSLNKYKSVTFNLKGTGFQNIRVDIEGQGYRWKSPNIQVSPNDQPVTLSFREFQRQQSTGNGWKDVRYRAPKDVQRFTIKTGETINSPDSAGTVTVSDIVFK